MSKVSSIGMWGVIYIYIYICVFVCAYHCVSPPPCVFLLILALCMCCRPIIPVFERTTGVTSWMTLTCLENKVLLILTPPPQTQLFCAPVYLSLYVCIYFYMGEESRSLVGEKCVARRDIQTSSCCSNRLLVLCGLCCAADSFSAELLRAHVSKPHASHFHRTWPLLPAGRSSTWLLSGSTTEPST